MMSDMDLTGLVADNGIIRNETAVFVTDNGVTAARLLAVPDAIISAGNGFCPALIEGKDFVVEGRELRLINMEVPHLQAEWLSNANVPDRIINLGQQYNITDVLLMEPRQLIEYQFCITYKPEQEDSVVAAASVQGSNEPLTAFRNKLASGQKPTVMIYGDSICNCANSSGEMGVEPFMPPWYDIALSNIAKGYGVPYQVINRSKSGYASDWGAENAEQNFADTQADLLIAGFGMNDCLGGCSPQDFGQNISKIIDSRRPQNCDYILISTILPNRQGAGKEYLEAYTAVLEGLCDESGRVMDMTAISYALSERKRYCDISGNNFNHPNDFVYGLYAKQLQKLL